MNRIHRISSVVLVLLCLLTMSAASATPIDLESPGTPWLVLGGIIGIVGSMLIRHARATKNGLREGPVYLQVSPVLLVAAFILISSNAEGQVRRFNALIPVPDLINTGVPTTTTFIANIEPNPNLIVESVRLIEVNAAGRAVRVVGRMYDDGTNGDQIANDNNYTLQMTIAELLPISLQYRATAAYRGTLLRITSPISNVTVAAPSFAKPADPALLITDDDGTYPVNQLIAFIVKGTPLSAVQALASSVGGAIVGYSSSVNGYQLELPTTNLSALNAAIAALEINPIVLDVLKNPVVMETATVDNDLTQLKAANPNSCFGNLPSASSPSCTGAYDKIRAIEGFQSLVDFNTQFSPIRVGVLDLSGALSTHEEFQGVDLIGGETQPTNSHATKMAGIIGANNRAAFGLSPLGQMNGLLAGVPSSANPSGSKVVYTLDTAGEDVESWFSTIAGIDRLATGEPARGGARVINMSIYVGFQSGGTLTSECAHAFRINGNDFFTRPDYFRVATQKLRESFQAHPKILFVATAGNFGTDVSNTTPGNIDEPNVITIGATDLFDKRAIWSLENFKPEVKEAIEKIEGCSQHYSSNFGVGVDLAAPGVDVYAPTASTRAAPTSDKWTFVDGTSPAAPLVAGTAGMLLAINPGLSPENLVGILKQTADPITSDQSIGGLRLNFEAAVLFVAQPRRERQLADVNGDGQADYCRFVGDAPNIFLSCNLALLMENKFDDDQYTFNSKPGIDVGYAGLPRLLADVNGDGRADYCRFVGDAPNIFLSCNLALLMENKFDDDQYTFNSKPGIDVGYAGLPRLLADVNGDGRADYCRFVGDAPNIFLSCNLALLMENKFDDDQYTFNSKPGIDVGYGL